MDSDHIELNNFELLPHSPDLLFADGTRPRYIGLVLATFSSLFFSLCSVIVKWLVDLDPTVLAAYRFIGVVLPTIPIVLYQGGLPLPHSRTECLLLFLRCLTGTISLVLSFYAFRHMALADASVIIFSVPVFTALFGRIFLKEPCGPLVTFCVIISLIGVVLITRRTTSTPSNNSNSSNMVALVATLCGAFAYILLRALKSLHFSVIMLNFGACGLVTCLVIIIIAFGLDVKCLVPACGLQRHLVVALGVFSFLGQIFLTLALQWEDAGPVAIARSTDIVYAFIWQMAFFDDTPDRYTCGGAVLVLTSVVLCGIRKWLLDAPVTSRCSQFAQKYRKLLQ